MRLKFIICLLGLFIYLPTTEAQQTNRKAIVINDFSNGIKSGLTLTEKGMRLSDNNEAGKYIIKQLAVPVKAKPFLAFSASWVANNWKESANTIWYRFYETENSIGQWKRLEIDNHADQKNNKWISELIFEGKDNRYVDIKINLSGDRKVNFENLQLHFFSPGESITIPGQTNNAAPKSVTCDCPIPAFETREDWCPSGDCPPNPNPSNTNVTHLIIHHSAGTNASSDWAGVVRSIWDYHVNTNGWSDIGYNYLIDPNGVLYEGRGNNILGAHFCGTNTGTMGVCVLGDFTNISPTNEAQSMLTELLSWKICDIDADPLGDSFHSASSQTLDHISGHQDGCATQCPGNTFYPQLNTVRNTVNDYINNSCTVLELLPPTNLEANVTSSTSMLLEWQDNATNETGFIIERSINNNSNYQQIGTTNANVSTYNDTNLMPNTAYFYRVKAFNTQEESDYSNEVGAATVFTSLADLHNDLGVDVFPNPVKDVLNIKTDKARQFSFQLFDYAGKLIKEDVWESFYQIDMTPLAKGIYLLKVSDGITSGAIKVQY